MFRFACGVLVVCLCGCVSQTDKSQTQFKQNISSKSISGPVVEISSKEISLGIIPAYQAEIKGIIPIFNPGTETLEVKKISGPCACFKGYSGDSVIQPGQGGEIEVHFDSAKIPAGHAKRSVRIETNDPSHPISEVYLVFEIQRSPEQEQNHMLREELAQLHSEIKALRLDVDLLKGQPLDQANSAKPAPDQDTKFYDIPVGNSPVLGSKDAAVTIVEFSDFQCSFCIKEHPTLKQILSEYPGKVRLVFKHFPLDFHKQSPAVHAAAKLAFQQKGDDAFWKLYEMILAEPKKLEPSVLKIYSQALGLDTAELDKTWADEKAMAELLKADKELAAKCNVGGTPTIFINGLKLSDRSIEGYRSRIDSILTSAEGKVVSRAQ